MDQPTFGDLEYTHKKHRSGGRSFWSGWKGWCRGSGWRRALSRTIPRRVEGFDPMVVGVGPMLCGDCGFTWCSSATT